MDWRERSEIRDDVVYFRYIGEGIEKNVPEVFVWDLDKTYLDTTIDSIRALLITATERALNKRNVPGTSTLLQTFTQRWIQRHGQSRFPIYFISASPPQIEDRIREKLSFDGINPFGCFYKDNLRNLSPKRWWRLTKQVGYKLQALLQLRIKLHERVRQTFWGDDSESDAIIYNLYSDICSRRMSTQDIRAILKHFFVMGEQVDRILSLQAQIPEDDPVDRIYINLAVDTDPEYYLKFGRRTLPTFNTFQIACDLFQDQRLNLEDVNVIVQDMMIQYNYASEELTRSFEDMVRRQVLGEKSVDQLIPFLSEKGIFTPGYKPALGLLKEKTVVNGRVEELDGHFEPWIASNIDYQHDYR